MTVRGTKRFTDNFDRVCTYATGVPAQDGWTVLDASAAGAPTYAHGAAEDGGSVVLTMAATDEVETLTFYNSDTLVYDLRRIHYFKWVAKVAGVTALTDVALGMCGATGATPAVRAWFHVTGATSTSTLYCGTDDAVTDSGLITTGTTLAAVYKEVKVDFTNGLSDIRFFVDGARVAAGTTFSMAGVAAGQNVQPFARVLKPSGTSVAALTLGQFEVQYTYAK